MTWLTGRNLCAHHQLVIGFILRQGQATKQPIWNHLILSRRGLTLWEPDRKSGWKTVEQASKQTPWYWQMVEDLKPAPLKESWKWLRKEARKWKKEKLHNLKGDNVQYLDHGDVRMVHDFTRRLRDEDEEPEWVATSDEDFGHGRSRAQFAFTQNFTALFHGYLNHTPVQDGVTQYAGYANCKSPDVQKAFGKESAHDWTEFTHLVLKVKGDGRNYMINLNTPGEFDISWNDMYCYPLYTHGGPYWQIERIPFSKFFLSHKGRAQDKQEPISLHRVSSLSITASDGIDGPFRLEIDWIAIEYDEHFTEEFAYEMYVGRKYEN